MERNVEVVRQAQAKSSEELKSLLSASKAADVVVGDLLEYVKYGSVSKQKSFDVIDVMQRIVPEKFRDPESLESVAPDFLKLLCQVLEERGFLVDTFRISGDVCLNIGW